MLPSFPRDDAHDLRGRDRSSNRRRDDDGDGRVRHGRDGHDGDAHDPHGRGRSSNRRHRHRRGGDDAHAPLLHDGDGRNFRGHGRSSNRHRHHRGDGDAHAPHGHDRSIHHGDVCARHALFLILLIHLTYELPLFIV